MACGRTTTDPPVDGRSRFRHLEPKRGESIGVEGVFVNAAFCNDDVPFCPKMNQRGTQRPRPLLQTEVAEATKAQTQIRNNTTRSAQAEHKVCWRDQIRNQLTQPSHRRTPRVGMLYGLRLDLKSRSKKNMSPVTSKTTVKAWSLTACWNGVSVNSDHRWSPDTSDAAIRGNRKPKKQSDSCRLRNVVVGHTGKRHKALSPERLRKVTRNGALTTTAFTESSKFTWPRTGRTGVLARAPAIEYATQVMYTPQMTEAVLRTP